MDVLERGTGRTYRQLLFTIAWASANPDKRALFLVHNAPMAEHVMHMARVILQPTKAVLKWTSRQIEMENGTVIQIRAPDQADKFRGLEYILYEDHAVEEQLRSDRDRATLAEIRAWAIDVATRP